MQWWLQVFLRGPRISESVGKSCKTTPLVYAASWWNADEARLRLQQEDQPIWTSLQGTELRRELQNVYCGHSEYLERSNSHPWQSSHALPA